MDFNLLGSNVRSTGRPGRYHAARQPVAERSWETRLKVPKTGQKAPIALVDITSTGGGSKPQLLTPQTNEVWGFLRARHPFLTHFGAKNATFSLALMC